MKEISMRMYLKVMDNIKLTDPLVSILNLVRYALKYIDKISSYEFQCHEYQANEAY